MNKRLVIAGVMFGAGALAVAPALATDKSETGPGIVAQCANAPLVVTGVSQVDSAASVVKSPAEFGLGAACFKEPASALTVTVSVFSGSTQLPYQVSFQKSDGYTSQTDAKGNPVFLDGCGSHAFTIPSGFQGGYVNVFAHNGTACNDTATAQQETVRAVFS